jgi:pyruvate formate lyase activating enzyme
MKEAIFWQKNNGSKVKCLLCNHFCILGEEQVGICGVRQNIDGVLYSLVYGNLVAENVDPIEKKPFFHFLPGSLSYSIATAGCNFRCDFCQNHNISQIASKNGVPYSVVTTPIKVVSNALNFGCQSISYTYTEPTVFFEFAFDTAKVSKDKGLKNCFVTNGYMNKDVIKEVSPYLDAANVDLKGDELFYKKKCGAKRSPVVDNIRFMKELGIWVEVTTLLIPEYNDSKSQIEELAEIIAGIDSNIPWHISRFFPTYKMSNHYPESIEKLVEARKIGMDKGLMYVYTGNAPGVEEDGTFCYYCKSCLIRRDGYTLVENSVVDNKCSVCGRTVDGVFN